MMSIWKMIRLNLQDQVFIDFLNFYHNLVLKSNGKMIVAKKLVISN
jgi:uncharacterized protein YqkB